MFSLSEFQSKYFIIMTIKEYEIVLEELQRVIDDAKRLMTSFEGAELDESMAAEYDALQELHQRAVKSQQSYTTALLDELAGQASTR